MLFYSKIVRAFCAAAVLVTAMVFLIEPAAAKYNEAEKGEGGSYQGAPFEFESVIRMNSDQLKEIQFKVTYKRLYLVINGFSKRTLLTHALVASLKDRRQSTLNLLERMSRLKKVEDRKKLLEALFEVIKKRSEEALKRYVKETKRYEAGKIDIEYLNEVWREMNGLYSFRSLLQAWKRFPADGNY